MVNLFYAIGIVAFLKYLGALEPLMALAGGLIAFILILALIGVGLYLLFKGVVFIGEWFDRNKKIVALAKKAYWTIYLSLVFLVAVVVSSAIVFGLSLNLTKSTSVVVLILSGLLSSSIAGFITYKVYKIHADMEKNKAILHPDYTINQF